MSNFASGYIKYINHLEQINDAALERPAVMIREVEDSYQEYLRFVSDSIVQHYTDARICMIAGPSASGKTTTAHLLQKSLSRHGIQAQIISLDDFYLDGDRIPLLPDGTKDYESVRALDVDGVHACLSSILQSGVCQVPSYDFSTSSRGEQLRTLDLRDNGFVIIEGIHALNPIFTAGLPAKGVVKLYVSVKQQIKDANGEVISPMDLRLVRRIARDVRCRNTGAEGTLSMWNNVVAGEDKYIRPYRLTADYTVNSIHIYEPCVLRNTVIPMLRQIPADSPYYRKARDLDARLMRFEPVSPELVPENSMLREFLG